MPQATPAPTAAEPTSAERQITRAKQLEKQRADLQKLIGKNREYLRLMASNDELTADQVKWLNAFYPEKERGSQRSDEEIKATREAKEEARKSAAATNGS